MDVSVGFIESYVPGSSWYDVTQYSDLGTQEQISVNLTSSDLWLVDQSQLNFQDSSEPPIVLPADGKLYESPVQISEVTLSDALPTLGGSYTPELSSITTTLPLETGGDVTFSGINGEIDSDAAALSTSSDSPSITLIRMMPPESSTTPTLSDSPLFTTTYPNSNPPSTETTSTTSDTPLLTPTALIPPTSITTLTTDLPPVLIPKTSDSEPNPVPIPVPFDTSSTLGLIFLAFLLMKRLRKKYTATQT